MRNERAHRNNTANQLSYHPRALNIRETTLPGVLLIEPKVHGDDRGFFMETYRVDLFREAGINDTFVQDNHSRSARCMLRGLIEWPIAKPVLSANERRCAAAWLDGCAS